MNDVDAEYYLRRCGEDALQRRDRSEDLHQRARALAALDVVSPAAAAIIVADYEQARDLRGLGDGGRDFEDSLSGEWTPPTIRSCGQTLRIEWGTITLHYLTIGPDAASIAVTMKPNPAAAAAQGRGRSRRRPFHDGPPDLDFADDKGNVLSGGFGGGGNGQEWEGEYSIHATLDPTIEFITVMGQRVDLGPSPDDVAVLVKEVDPSRPASERAARYVRRSLAAPTNRHYDESTVPIAIDTFLACDILTPDADVVVRAAEAKRVSAQAMPGISPRAAGYGGSVRPARAIARLANRTVGVCVALPDGVHMAITDLRSTSEGVLVGFQAAVTSADALVRSVGDCFAMTATDDAGVEHPGELDNWGSSAGTFNGRMRFPALTSATSTFSLRVMTDRADVDLVIPLRWEGVQ